MSKIDAIIDSILNFDSADTVSSAASESAVASREDATSTQFGQEHPSDKVATAENSSAKPSDGRAFPDPSPDLTQKVSHNIAFDFNAGARISVPSGRWRVKIMDIERSLYLYNEEASNCTILGAKRYFIRTRIEIESLDTNETVLTHDYDCRDRDVAILLPGGTLGDAIGWFSYAVKFQEKHDCRLTVGMSADACKLFAGQYAGIRCCTFAEYEADRERFYATYYIGLFFQDEDHNWQPSDFRLVGLHRTAAHILGVDDGEIPPRIVQWPINERPIDRPYVVIATQASSQCKYWNNPIGWSTVIAHLHELGYEVVCIDKNHVGGHGNHWNYIPHGTRDETGDRPLAERAYWLRHAAFFIGLSSGLSWLAWAAGTPVVMISGFTHPSNEFQTPYRIFNPHVCNSCWHDVRTPFQHDNLLFCPRHADTPRQFECTRLITPMHVMSYCDQLHAQLTAQLTAQASIPEEETEQVQHDV
ncbi:autotransporter strand-loop-strand O-heptosyltransferase [Asaia bogorensis]|uniref:autotransporter strand-loop-strand O-heptosyltransferase n=1 Tax=Asaia bogorensis TaxID=91915 RepID=UPI000EFC10E5|nr:autotransporter strand-loop-strand O-heptosyltransferase [Asaia bogorensis]